MLLWEEIAVVIVGMFKCITSKSKKLQVNQTFYIYDYFIGCQILETIFYIKFISIQ